MKHYSIFIILFTWAGLMTAQNDILDVIKPKENSYVREGNRAYDEGDFAKSEVYYKKAREKDANHIPGNFNLGGAMYQQERYEDAANQFDLAANLAKDEPTRAQAYHNMGNSLVAGEKYQEAVEAYKRALKANPKDEDTRYNLAYAMQKLKQQQQQQQQDKDQKQDQDQDQNQDQENQGENQENQENQDEQEQKPDENQEQDQQDQENKPGQMQNPQMSQEEIERMLEALKFQEEQLQEKLQRAKAKGQRTRVDKDW